MNLPDSLDSKVRPFATALLDAKPEFEANFCILESGGFETHVPAPAGSKAGALVVTTNEGDVWVRFAPPQMFYLVDNADELLLRVDQLLSSSIVFVRVEDDQGEWIETTLMAASSLPTLERGQRATVVSWSGEFDKDQLRRGA